MPTKLLGNNKQGLLFVVSAPAGTGKTTIVNLLVDEFPKAVIQSVSYTTRKPRPNEIDGVHYNFVTEEKFREMLLAGDFLENVELFGNHYGTSKQWVEKQLKAGKHVVLVIDIQGAFQLMGQIPFTMIFIKPPSLAELKKRLIERDTECEETIAERLEVAKHELEMSQRYDYEIINDDLQTAYQVLRSILIAKEHKVKK